MAKSKTYQQLRQQAINILSGMSISGRHPQTTLDRVVRIFNRYAANIQAYFAKTGGKPKRGCPLRPKYV